MSRLRVWVTSAVAAVLGGCALYHAKPLDDTARAQALAPMQLERVKVAAARLEHPLVKPIMIDGQGGFTPDEIAVMAVIVSPQLRALRDQRGVAQAQVIQAGILPNPQWSYAIDYPHHTDPTAVAAKNSSVSWDLLSAL